MIKVKSIITKLSTWRFFLLSTLVWLLIFALTVSESVIFYQINNQSPPYGKILLNDAFILSWIPITPIMYFVIKGYYLKRKQWLKLAFVLVLILILGMAAALAIESVLRVIMLSELENQSSWFDVFSQLILFRFHSNLILGAGFLASSLAILAYSESRQLAEEQEVLNRNLIEAQLGILKAQMKPHFLFNSLHAISGLILKKENDLAISVIAKLSDLLRESLHMDEKKWITLKEELDFIKRYLEIYMLRFGEQLTYSIEIDKDAEKVMVPPAILQPLVENALVHAIVPNDNSGHISIKSKIDSGKLKIDIEDQVDQKRFQNEKIKEGIGLTNTKKRLDSLYASNFQFLYNFELGLVSVVIPVDTHIE